MEIIIREADVTAIRLLQELADRSWAKAYKDILSREQMDYMLTKMYAATVLQQQMEAGHQFLLLQVGSSAVGFAGFEYNNGMRAGVTKLHKLYLTPETQGKGYGKLLITEAEIRSVRAGQQEVELNVNRKNKALQFYQHLGYIISEEVDLDIGQGFFMNDYVLRKKL